MAKTYTISIVVSGEQGEVMRRDSTLPLAMYDVLKDALDLPKHYQAVADALAIGPVTIYGVCALGVTKDEARRLLRAAGAKVVEKVNGVAYWGLA